MLYPIELRVRVAWRGELIANIRGVGKPAAREKADAAGQSSAESIARLGPGQTDKVRPSSADR